VQKGCLIVDQATFLFIANGDYLAYKPVLQLISPGYSNNPNWMGRSFYLMKMGQMK